MDQNKLIFFDIETTGLDRDKAEIIQLAYLVTDSDGLGTVEFESLYNPGGPIPPEISGLTNIDNNDVIYKEEFKQSSDLQSFKKYADDGFIAVAHNADFDVEFVKKYGIQFRYSICTYKIATKLYPKLGNHKLGTLRAFLGLSKPTGELHSALVDTKVLFDVYNKMTSDFKSIEEILDYTQAAAQDLLAVWKFGKFKGEKVDFTKHRSYIEWYLKQPTDPKYPKDEKFLNYLRNRL